MYKKDGFLAKKKSVICEFNKKPGEILILISSSRLFNKYKEQQALVKKIGFE